MEHTDLIHGGETKLEDGLKRHIENAMTANGHSAHRKRLSPKQKPPKCVGTGSSAPSLLSRVDAEETA